MSPLTAQQIVDAVNSAAQADVETAIRNVATLASIALALLTLLTNGLDAVRERHRGDLAKVTRKLLHRALYREVAAILITAVILVLLTPLLVDALNDGADPLQGTSTLRYMYAVIYAGFAGVLAWQCWILVRHSSLRKRFPKPGG